MFSSSSSSSSSSSHNKEITVNCGTQNGGRFWVTVDGNQIDCPGNTGVGLFVFDNKDLKTPTTKKIFESNQISSLCTQIEKIKDGNLVVLGFKGDCSKLITDDLKQCLTTLGSREITRLDNRDCWAMLLKKGSSNTLYEMRKPDTLTFTRSLDLCC